MPEITIPENAPIIKPVPVQGKPIPVIFEEKKESSASLLPSSSSAFDEYVKPLSETPTYPPIPDKAPTFYNVLEPIPEESNNDLIDNVKAQEKANDDVYDNLTEHEEQFEKENKKAATKYVNAANYNNLKELKQMYKELGGKNDYEKSMVKYREGIQALQAKKEYQNLGGVNDFDEDIKKYHIGIQALKYKRLLQKKGSKLNDNKKKEIFNFHNLHYEPLIPDEKKLNVKDLKDAYSSDF